MPSTKVNIACNEIANLFDINAVRHKCSLYPLVDVKIKDAVCMQLICCIYVEIYIYTYNRNPCIAYNIDKK